MNQTHWKILSYLALSLGLGVIVWLVSAASLTAVAQSLLRIGWGALAVVAVRAVMIVTNGVAWSRLLTQLTTVPTRVFLLARWIREAVDVLLPVAYVGGGLIGARILTFWRMPSVIAVASAAADLFLQIVAQALFAAFGATLLMRLIGARNVLPDAKRIPDLLLGLPGLLTWHTLETHHLLLRRGAGPPQEAGRNGGGELEASSSLINSEK